MIINRKKILSAFVLLTGMLCMAPAINANAAIKGDTINIVDYGNGFYLPDNFDLIDADGNLAYLEKFNPEWLCVEYDGTPVTMDLGNGYTASREYAYQWYYDNDMDVGKPYVYTLVRDADGNIVFGIGRDGAGTAFSCVIAENGDYAYDYFSEPTLVSNDEGKLVAGEMEGELADKISGDTFNLAHTNEDEDGMWVPRSRVAVSQETQTQKEYVLMFDGLRLARTMEYGTDKGIKYTDYNVVYPSVDGLAEDDDYYESWTYYEYDLQFVTLESTHVLYDLSGEVHPGMVTQMTPSVKYRHGEAYYLFIFEEREPSDYLDPTTGIIHTNMRDQTIGYFTKEQIEIIEAEGLKSSAEIYEAHRDFFFDPLHGEVIVDEEDEYVDPYEEKANAVIDGDERDTDEIKASSGPQIAGGITQTIVGDVVPINGKTPAYAITRTMINGDIRVDLYDASNQEVAVGSAFDLDHTNYKYVYFEFVSIMDNGYVIFRVSGTNDSSKSGNLGGYGIGVYDTENGQTGADDYYQAYGGPEDLYDESYDGAY